MHMHGVPAERGLESGPGVTEGCDPPHGCCEQNLDPWKSSVCFYRLRQPSSPAHSLFSSNREAGSTAYPADPERLQGKQSEGVPQVLSTQAPGEPGHTYLAVAPFHFWSPQQARQTGLPRALGRIPEGLGEGCWTLRPGLKLLKVPEAAP